MFNCIFHRTIILVLIPVVFGCSGRKTSNISFNIIQDVLDSKVINQLYEDISDTAMSQLPIGIFDSGTGGLAVLETILKSDQYNNINHEMTPDSIPDFENEAFIFLADEANMPYGRYYSEDKADFLRELIIKDVLFLLGNRYYKTPYKRDPEYDKPPVKEIVIACNTATAYGLETVKTALNTWDVPVNITGIIEAGARGTLEALDNSITSPLVAILATEGTVASGGYPASIKKIASAYKRFDDLKVIQQAGFGLAGAIDGDANYLDPSASGARSINEYFGPDITNDNYPVRTDLWSSYNFSSGNNLFVVKNENGDTLSIQLNSVDNYVKYMITHLVYKTFKTYPGKSIDAIILGCTHYAYVNQQIREHLQFLQTNNPMFSTVLQDTIILVDPSESLAAELYKNLVTNRKMGNSSLKDNLFFISVPNPYLMENIIDKKGEFTFDWKYGREINTKYEFVKRVPFSKELIDNSVMNRMMTRLPKTYSLIK